MLSQHLKAIGVDAAAGNFPLTVDGRIHGIVIFQRIKGGTEHRVHVLIADIVRIAIARVRILDKVTVRTASIGTLCRSRRQHIAMLVF